MDIIDKIDMYLMKEGYKVLYPDGKFKHYTSDNKLKHKKEKTVYKVLRKDGKFMYFDKNNKEIDKKTYNKLKKGK
jgi:hypothetical protein